MQKLQHTLFLKVLIISTAILFISGCDAPNSFEEIIQLEHTNTEYQTDSKYLKICIEIANFTRSTEHRLMIGMMNFTLQEDEFLFHINTTELYPNLAVISRNNECWFAEQTYPIRALSFEHTKETITGTVKIKHYHNYIEFIQEKYNTTNPPENMQSVYITAPEMSEKLHQGRLAVVDPISQLHPIQIKIRGGYGRASPKKSYSIHFLQPTTIHKITGKVLYLQGHFNDPNLNRNTIALQLYGSLGYRIPKTKLVNLYLNERYIGVYELTNRIDKELLDFEYALNDPTRIYKISLYGNNCAHAESVQTNKSFCEEEILLDKNQAIDYYLLMKITGAVDNIGKNYFISLDENNKTHILPWDLDYTFYLVNSEQKLAGNAGNPYLYEVISQNIDTVVKQYYKLRENEWSDENLISLTNISVLLDQTLAYEKYIFPERLPYTNITEYILNRAAYLDSDFKKIVQGDIQELMDMQ